MNKITFYTVLVIILFFGCKNKSSEEFEKHQAIIKYELATGNKTNDFFLGFTFNDNIKKYKQKVDSLNVLGKIQAFTYQEGQDTICEVIYEFKDTGGLNGIDFLLYPKRHNDSLQGIILLATNEMTWKSNYKSVGFIFSKLVERYTLEYGEPNYQPKPTNVFWIMGNLEINLEISESTKIADVEVKPYLSITYSNTRKKQELVDRHFRNVLFVGYDTVDKWYQDENEKATSDNPKI